MPLFFQKFTLHHFTLMKDLHQYTFLLTQKNPKRTFTFTKNRESKSSLWLALQQPVTKGECTQALPGSFSRNHAPYHSIKPPLWWTEPLGL